MGHAVGKHPPRFPPCNLRHTPSYGHGHHCPQQLRRGRHIVEVNQFFGLRPREAAGSRAPCPSCWACDFPGSGGKSKCGDQDADVLAPTRHKGQTMVGFTCWMSDWRLSKCGAKDEG